MAVKNISRQEFNQLFPYACELSQIIGEAAEWFADDAHKDILGLITRSTSGNVWSYAILTRGGLGSFRVSSIGGNFLNAQMARAKCQAAMAAAAVKTEQSHRLPAN